MKVKIYKNGIYMDTWEVENGETVLDVIAEAISKGYTKFEIVEESK